MSIAADVRARGRAHTRALLRDLALDAARRTVLTDGWSAVRMGAVAAEVGLSRQSLHAEFGTKDELGQALISRTTHLLVDGISRCLDEHLGDVNAGLTRAACFALESAAADPLLQAALRGAPQTGDASLLPLLTSRSEPLLRRGAEVLTDWLARAGQDITSPQSALAVECAVRLLISHAVAPTHAPKVAARQIAVGITALLAPPTGPGRDSSSRVRASETTPAAQWRRTAVGIVDEQVRQGREPDREG